MQIRIGCLDPCVVVRLVYACKAEGAEELDDMRQIAHVNDHMVQIHGEWFLVVGDVR